MNEQLRIDVEAYRRLPQTTEERALANFAAPSGLADDVDWAHSMQTRRDPLVMLLNGVTDAPT